MRLGFSGRFTTEPNPAMLNTLLHTLAANSQWAQAGHVGLAVLVDCCVYHLMKTLMIAKWI